MLTSTVPSLDGVGQQLTKIPSLLISQLIFGTQDHLLDNGK